MVAIQVRDVPDDVRDALAAEAESRGQSLQLFLSEVLAREAASARNLAWLREQRATPQSPPPAASTRDVIREAWEERDARIGKTRVTPT
jgi:hypothetical protein